VSVGFQRGGAKKECYTAAQDERRSSNEVEGACKGRGGCPAVDLLPKRGRAGKEALGQKKTGERAFGSN